MSFRLLRSPEAPKITSANGSRTRSGSDASTVAARLTWTPAFTRVGSVMSSSPSRAGRAPALGCDACQRVRRRRVDVRPARGFCASVRLRRVVRAPAVVRRPRVVTPREVAVARVRPVAVLRRVRPADAVVRARLVDAFARPRRARGLVAFARARLVPRPGVPARAAPRRAPAAEGAARFVARFFAVAF